jgi:hypothetical protein
MTIHIPPQARPLTVLAGLLLSCTLLLGGPTACSPFDPQPYDQVGRVELALRSASEDSTYELRNASFSVVGPTEQVLESDAAPDDEALNAELPVGDYTVELLGGWQLFEVGQTPTELTARLLSDNPLPFTIEADQTTSLRFRFEIDGEEVDLGGQLELGFDVETAVVRNVLFSELMANPAELADSEGEWIEIHNAGSDSIDLDGCVIERDATQLTISASLEVQPGQSVALANSDAPGFAPDYVYSSLTLPNSAVFTLNLTCQDQLLDTVTVDPGSWPGGAGVSTALDGSSHSASTNDDASRWCNATTPYNTDLGTPGAVNPDCG